MGASRHIISGKGIHNARCDSCGLTFKSNELRKRWDNLMVCAKDYEVRHPLDFLRVENDQLPNDFTRLDDSPDFSLNFGALSVTSAGDVPAASNVKLVGTGDIMTVQATIQPRSDMTSRQIIISNAAGGQAGTWAIDVGGVTARAISVGFNPNGFTYVSPPILVPYHEYKISYVQTTGRSWLYVNGVPQPNRAVAAYNAAAGVAAAALSVGSLAAAAPFVGLIKEVRLWSTARTQAQIEQDVLLAGTETGLLDWWKLNNGSGTTVVPNSTADATAIMTLTNTTWVNY